MPQGKLTIELIELSRNKTIREMFTSVQAGKEIDRFVALRHLHLRIITTASGKREGIELTGDMVDLNEFFKAFLIDDATQGIYTFDTGKD